MCWVSISGEALLLLPNLSQQSNLCLCQVRFLLEQSPVGKQNGLQRSASSWLKLALQKHEKLTCTGMSTHRRVCKLLTYSSVILHIFGLNKKNWQNIETLDIYHVYPYWNSGRAMLFLLIKVCFPHVVFLAKPRGGLHSCCWCCTKQLQQLNSVKNNKL